MVRMCDLQTAWKTLNAFMKFSLCVIDEFLTCSAELPLLRFVFFSLSWLKYACPIQFSNYFSFAVWDADKWEGASVYVYIYSDS